MRPDAPPWLAGFAAHVTSRADAGDRRAPLLIRVSDAAGSLWTAELPGPPTEGAPPADDRPFRIASVTKVHVAAALLRLVEDGRLETAAPLGELVGADIAALLRGAGYDPAAITLDQVMRHTAGLRDHCSSAPFLERLKVEPGHRWTRAEQVTIAMRLGPPLSRPGDAFAYSDTGYVILGEVVERASGAALGEALPALLRFRDIGLRLTRLDDGNAPDRLQRQFMGEVDAGGFHPSFDLFGGGGLVSTLAELDLFLRALFEGAVFARPETLDRVCAATLTPSDCPGYGHNGLMFRASLAGLDVWAHTGFWGVQAAYLPERRLVLTATFNRSPESGVYDKDELLEDFARAAATEDRA